MISRVGRSITRMVLLLVGLFTLPFLAGAPAYAVDLVEDTIAGQPRLCLAGDGSCITRTAPRALTLAVAAHEAPAPPAPSYKDGIPNEKLSLYKTITYVTGATLTDQLWYLLIASEAATTGGIFFVVNATTSSMMTYSYEYFWNICCNAPPGPDGIVPVSATKAIIYRGLSIIRVGGLALLFGNTIASASVVTLAITLSRTAVYVTNDYVWNHIDVRKRAGPSPTDDPTATPPRIERPVVGRAASSAAPRSAESFAHLISTTP